MFLSENSGLSVLFSFPLVYYYEFEVYKKQKSKFNSCSYFMRLHVMITYENIDRSVLL
jgi:hypothetical protein